MFGKTYQSCLYTVNGEIKCQYLQDKSNDKSPSIDHDDLFNLRIMRYELMSNINFRPKEWIPPLPKN